MPSITIEHPVLLGVIALLCSPLLVHFARRLLLDDLDEMRDAIDRPAVNDIWWKMIRFDEQSSVFFGKALVYVVAYGIVVAAIYAAIAPHLHPAQA